MSQEQANPSAEQTLPEPSAGDLARNAALAMGVIAWWTRLCQPAIDANKRYIKENPGVLSTVAKLEGIQAAKFTESTTNPSFEITDRAAFLKWADSHGETEWVVRKAFQDAILKKRARWVNGEAVDSVTGEVIPGVTRNPGGAHISVKPTFTEAGEELLARRLDEVFGPAAAALLMLGPASVEDAAEGTE
ncbi:hypothetical protein HCJ76_44255 [Streptomyces sp. MC1]|uniref:hypothetical protein n=1 Tax=Streptomyces sp. MC1 TaxID=295105 RepID=UPI0018C9154D|nr:hypothetical protein [Streptomyces sp. MC1]MBG7704898.1 hypothetical protein [Streptomyces sp. MC1]